jgi:hypothetical protein
MVEYMFCKQVCKGDDFTALYTKKNGSDFLLDVGASFDLITPLLAFLTDLVGGPVADFGVDPQSGWSLYDIRAYLKENEISAWGIMYTPNCDALIFTVRKEDAEETFFLLQYAGIPILYMPSL